MKTMLVRERYKVVQVCGMETSGAGVSSMGTATFVQTMGNAGVEATETYKKSGVRTVKHMRNMWSGAVVVLLTVLCMRCCAVRCFWIAGRFSAMYMDNVPI